MADQSSGWTSGSGSRPQCYNCGGLDHWAVACPEPTRKTPAGLLAWKNSANGGRGDQRHHGNGPVKSKGPIITRYAPPPPPGSGPPGPHYLPPPPGGYQQHQQPHPPHHQPPYPPTPYSQGSSFSPYPPGGPPPPYTAPPYPPQNYHQPGYPPSPYGPPHPPPPSAYSGPPHGGPPGAPPGPPGTPVAYPPPYGAYPSPNSNGAGPPIPSGPPPGYGPPPNRSSNFNRHSHNRASSSHHKHPGQPRSSNGKHGSQNTPKENKPLSTPQTSTAHISHPLPPKPPPSRHDLQVKHRDQGNAHKRKQDKNRNRDAHPKHGSPEGSTTDRTHNRKGPHDHAGHSPDRDRGRAGQKRDNQKSFSPQAAPSEASPDRYQPPAVGATFGADTSINQALAQLHNTDSVQEEATSRTLLSPVQVEGSPPRKGIEHAAHSGIEPQKDREYPVHTSYSRSHESSRSPAGTDQRSMSRKRDHDHEEHDASPPKRSRVAEPAEGQHRHAVAEKDTSSHTTSSGIDRRDSSVRRNSSQHISPPQSRVADVSPSRKDRTTHEQHELSDSDHSSDLSSLEAELLGRDSRKKSSPRSPPKAKEHRRRPQQTGARRSQARRSRPDTNSAYGRRW